MPLCWRNKERLSLAGEVELKNRTWDESTKVEQEKKNIRGKNSREVELKNRTWDESTKVEQETKDIRGKNSLRGVKVLDKESVDPSKEEYEKNKREDVLGSYVESSVRVSHAFWNSCTRLDIRERGQGTVGTVSVVVVLCKLSCIFIGINLP
ncbi:hypothetical protein NDU88_001530 [Pleurodeles waltl]|uniref:Uncharacterized protein n=1 Tax=Pleurodeles waltl TaxID=8319 RepID=A0AAV7M5K7_PLEWA|nr:hypothetical protein NDU88_001530 [Pleurodeles waltl]